ncbi:MAG: type IV pilus modification protein PilV [Chromatiaceae bacterium]|jgi:type IV pilus assembly protein PilV
MNSRTLEQGVGLIEILISLLVIAVGLLGMAALQGRAQQSEFESYQRAQALILADDMANRLRANRVARACYDLAAKDIDSIGTGATYTASGCNTAADADLAAWHNSLLGAAEVAGEQNVGAMIGARGCIRTDAAGDFVVSVAWQGMTETVAPADTCGQGAYGTEKYRRVVSTVVSFATL